jgi:creatinine amidohydrolase/Fe(II)-dependent formamide hydrolase-like protein
LSRSGTPRRLLHELGHDVATGSLTGSVALLPAGSVEQHGPHGPLGTDTLIARELAERVASGRPRVVVLPELAYMPCPPETRDAAGTIDVPAPVAEELLGHLLRALLRMGCAGVVVLNAHIGNVEPAGRAADAVRREFPGALVSVLNWWETLPAGETAALAGFTENGGHGHAGPLEMSVAEAIAPGLVRPELARGYPARMAETDAGHGARLLELAAERLGAAIDEVGATAAPRPGASVSSMNARAAGER